MPGTVKFIGWKEDKKLLEPYEANLKIIELENKYQNLKFILSNCNKVEERLKKGYEIYYDYNYSTMTKTKYEVNTIPLQVILTKNDKF